MKILRITPFLLCLTAGLVLGPATAEMQVNEGGTYPVSPCSGIEAAKAGTDAAGEANKAEAQHESDAAGDSKNSEDEEIEEIEELEEVEPEGNIPAWDSRAYPRIERVVNIMTARTLRKRSFLFTIDHRTWLPIKDDTFHNFFGFDGGNLKIGLGLRYGILDNLDVGVLRLNGTFPRGDVDTYDFDAKFQFLHQDRHFLDAAARGGITWFSIRDEGDSAGFFLQFFVNRTVCNRLRLGTGLLYASDSYNEGRGKTDDDYSVAVPVTAEVRLSRLVALNGEIVPNVAGFGEKNPVYAASVKFITHKHTFAIVISNTQYIGPDGIATNTDRDFGDTIIGFTITRELPI